MSKVQNENYIQLSGWMVNELNLKGNELVIYAIIYGFSQTPEHKFRGSLQYLMDWTNSTKQGVLKNIKSLIEKGYIEKDVVSIDGVNKVYYRSTKFTDIELIKVNKVHREGQQSLPNNIDDNKELVIDNKDIPYDRIIDYLNKRTGSSYRPSSKKTRDLIKARFNEGFTEEDFYQVIDKKTADWLSDNRMNKFLRPETLFGTKFESYLNQKAREMTTKDLADKMDFSGFMEF